MLYLILLLIYIARVYLSNFRRHLIWNYIVRYSILSIIWACHLLPSVIFLFYFDENTPFKWCWLSCFLCKFTILILLRYRMLFSSYYLYIKYQYFHIVNLSMFSSFFHNFIIFLSRLYSLQNWFVDVLSRSSRISCVDQCVLIIL